MSETDVKTSDVPGDPAILKAKSLNDLEKCLADAIGTFINGSVSVNVNEFTFDQSNVERFIGNKGVATFSVEVKSKN